MLALQTDVYSAYDRFCAERFVYALDHVQNLSDRARRARELLRDWDGRLTMDSVAATIEGNSRRELIRLLLEPKLGTLNWKNYRWEMSSIWLENVLLKQPPRWLPEKYQNYDVLLAAAVEAAISSPEVPNDLSQWRWGKFSLVDIEHPILATATPSSR